MVKERFKPISGRGNGSDHRHYGSFVGDYVIIDLPNGGFSAGKLIGIDGGVAYLQPFLTSSYLTGVRTKVLSEDTRTIELAATLGIEPTTRRNLEAFCKVYNADEERSRRKRDEEAPKTPNN